MIQADKLRLRQVLLNLIGNANKFTSNGTVLTEVEISQDKDSTLVFRILDDGIGMSPETLEKIFKPFVQGDSSMTKKFGGTGLGLIISKNIIETMGGAIGVTSEVGKGSCFTFSIKFKKVSLQNQREVA